MVAIIILNKMMMQEEEVSLQVKVGHFVVVNYGTLTLFVSFYSTQQPEVKKKMVNHSP